MYLLYLDESGNEDDPADRNFVLAGVAIFERQAYFLSQALEKIEGQFFPGSPPVEFHASLIRSGRGFWRNIRPDLRSGILQRLVDIVVTAPSGGLSLSAAVVEKSCVLYGEDAVKRATEEICQRFDIFLMRKHHEEHDPQRGLLVFSEGKFHQRARLWVRGFRELGTRWNVLRNLCDIPYFASPRDTRLLQIADLVAHAVFLLYERRDASLALPLLNRFDRKEGRLHGLIHVTRDRSTCDCPGCWSRRVPDELGPWVSPEPTAG